MLLIFELFLSFCRAKLSFVLLLAFALAGCASTNSDDNYDPYNGNRGPAAAAYAADGFIFSVAMPKHPPVQDMDFYYKECTKINDRAHFSKASFECTGPMRR